MNRRWTDSELALLRKEYPRSRSTELAEKLDRPVYEVNYRARKLGLSKAEGHHRWTEEEISLLKELFPNTRLRIEEVAERIGKGIKAVRTKASQMGLRRTRRAG